MKMQIKYLFSAKLLVVLLLSTSFVGMVSAADRGGDSFGGSASGGRPRSDSEEAYLSTLQKDIEALRNSKRMMASVSRKLQQAVYEEVDLQSRVPASATSEDFDDTAKPGLLADARTWTVARFSTRAETAKTVAGLAALGSAGYLGREYIGSAARAIGGGIKGAATGAVAGARGHK